MSKPPKPRERLGTSVPGSEVLRTVVGIAELGSIAAAARAEDISPSLASRRLASLEAAFDTTLFQRTTRRLQLTGAGQLVLAWARESLRHHAHLVDELGEQQHRLAGLLRIACNEYTGSRYLLQATAALRQQHPALRFIITMSDEPIRLIEQGYDLVIHAGRLPDSNLIGRRIRSYSRILCAAPAYLERNGVPLAPADLVGHACLTHSRSEPRNWFFRKGDGPVFAQPVEPAVEINSYPLLLDLAVSGAGIVRISAGMVAGAVTAGQLVQVLGDYACVGLDGQEPAIWLIQPDRRLTYRARVFADRLWKELAQR